MRRPTEPALRAAWLAMKKFASDADLTDAEWAALSALTMIDKSARWFGPGNVRWTFDAEERAENLAFYRSLGTRVQ